MKRAEFLTILVFCSLIGMGQNIRITFTGTGDVTQIDTVTATNLTTKESVMLPGNDTLILTVNTGIRQILEETGNGIIFPNPFIGSARFNLTVFKVQTASLKLQNLVGQVVAQKTTFILPGENQFDLAVNQAGIYLLSLTTEEGIYSCKIICTEATEPACRIEYTGTSGYRAGNSDQPGLKTSNTGYFLSYELGDEIRYHCKSGIYTTIMTDSPTDSKNYLVEFWACADPHGRNYSIVKIGDQTWMAENLAYLPAVSRSDNGSETAIHYYVYGYNGTSPATAKALANYASYGVLYNWPAALTVCPSGWHLPSDEEWTNFADYLADTGYGYRGYSDDIAKSLASNSGWDASITAGSPGTDQAGNNRTGFSAVPGGCRDYTGGFMNARSYAFFWSSLGSGTEEAWYRMINSSGDGLGRSYLFRSNGFSVRCLRDAPVTR